MTEEKNILLRLATHPVALGTVVALAIGFAGALLLSLIFFATPLSEAYLQPSANVLYLAGAFFGGFAGAKRAGRKGILFGIETGFCYFLIAAMIILIFTPAAFTGLALILKGLYALIMAMVGGIFGIAFTD